MEIEVGSPIRRSNGPSGIGAKGNEGVSNNVSQTKGSIGYVEYAYAKQNGMTTVAMINKDGKTVVPEPRCLPGRCRLRGLGKVLRLLRHPYQPGRAPPPGRCGRDLHPHLQAAAGPGGGRRSPEVLCLGLRQRRQDGRSSSITFRCRKRSSIRSRSMWAKEITDASGKPLYTARWRTSFDAKSAGLIAVAQCPAPLSLTGLSREYLARRPVDRLSGRLLDVDGARWMDPARRRSVVDVALQEGAMVSVEAGTRASVLDRLRLGDIAFRHTDPCCGRRRAVAP